MLSGMIEFLLGAPGTMLYFGAAVGGARAGFGIVVGLILNPFLPFVFLFAEGAVRFLAAVSTAQILPMLPLQIISWLHDRKEGVKADRLLGPLIPDRVERGDGESWDLRILSCRPKAHWNPYMTIRFENRFYQTFREDMSPGPQKFVYLLREHPKTRLVVVVYEYAPNDVLTPDAPPRRWKP
jgi:hypothetical protein